LLFKGKFHKDFIQRFGFLPKNVTALDRPVWIHAVSVGEAVLGAKVAAGIKKKFPSKNVIVSTTTRTGNEMALKSGKGTIDAVFYYPLDVRPIVKRVMRDINPCLYLIAETELWPNLLEECKINDVPVILVNGRISDNSFRNYRKISFITRRIFDCFSSFCVQSKKDKERIIELGGPSERIVITGSMKFDGHSIKHEAAFSEEKLGFKKNHDIFIAGSTHYPEEKIIIGLFAKIKKNRDNLKLILAPRHVERKEAVKIYIEKHNLKYRFLSDIIGGREFDGGEYDVLLVDTIGHLSDLYSLGTIIYIGGSFSKRGGQNPIEAASWGKAVVFGPNMSNFREVSNIFLENNAALSAKDSLQLEEKLEELLMNPEKRMNLEKNAIRVIKENQGATEKVVEVIEGFL